MTNSRPAQDARAGPRLVAVLDLDLVQRQRIVLVGRVLALHQQGEQLLVRRREQVVGVLAVVQAEQVVAVVVPPPARLEDLARDERREVHLLRADPRHPLADDPRHVLLHHHAERQPRVDAGRDPADVARADEQLVAGHLGVGRVVAQRPQEQRRHPQHGHRGRCARCRRGPGSRASSLMRARLSTRAEDHSVAPYARRRGRLRPGDPRFRLGQLGRHARLRRLAGRDRRGGRLRRDVPERRLHPDQDVRLPRRPRRPARATPAGSAWTRTSTACAGATSATGSSGASTRSRRAVRDYRRDGANTTLFETHALVRRRAHPAARHRRADHRRPHRHRDRVARGRPARRGRVRRAVPHVRHRDAHRRRAATGGHPRRRLHRRGVRARLLRVRRGRDAGRARRRDC